MLGAVNCGGSTLADILGKVVSRDGPAGERVAVHEVAKLVNSSGRSKLNALALVLDASPAASLTFAFLQWSPLCPRFTWENSSSGWYRQCCSPQPRSPAAAGKELAARKLRPR